MRKLLTFVVNEKYFLPFLFSIAATAVTTYLLLFVRNEIETTTVALLYLFPVGINAAIWGLWPGIMAALISFFSLNYFFLPPYGTLTVHQSQDILALIVFLILAISISQLIGRMKDNLNNAQERESETTRLYELSLTLSKQHREMDIIHSLAEHLLKTFQPDQLEILVETESGRMLLRLPERPLPGLKIPEQPSLLVTLQGASHLLGEIRLWRNDRPFNQIEDRLLRTSASQGVLALERARLTASENRASILEESDKMKSSLLSSVSHELRTPLATIKASVTSLLSEDVPWDPETRRDLLTAINEESDHLNQLVGNLLNMSRIEAGGLQLKCHWNVLTDIAAGAIKQARHAGHGHRFELDIPEDFPLIYVDDVLIEQVFNNLISNSLKYSPSESVIQIKARPLDDLSVWVQVNNQGPAVSNEDLVKIFDKFHRVTAADQITGVGLGLSICKGIIEAHHGRIWAENLEQGFAIRFSLPIHAGGEVPRIPDQ